ncbi:hypothetical protein NDU88_005440 [Pleurodeles waltl]|uniref:Uncharacterized protein n=1 Tax=Pleurodeles waltl TaxID=8319 RepID=A0AAV7LPJ0_PLEWA|nr:hypothetical protein NDU88_005440 [Pleurodeles waltl]
MNHGARSRRQCRFIALWRGNEAAGAGKASSHLPAFDPRLEQQPSATPGSRGRLGTISGQGRLPRDFIQPGPMECEGSGHSQPWKVDASMDSGHVRQRALCLLPTSSLPYNIL